MSDNHYKNCKKAFENDYSRILRLAKAEKECASYNRVNSGISFGKAVWMGLLPLTVCAEMALKYKLDVPGKFAAKRSMFLQGFGGLLVFSGALGAWSW